MELPFNQEKTDNRQVGAWWVRLYVLWRKGKPCGGQRVPGRGGGHVGETSPLETFEWKWKEMREKVLRTAWGKPFLAERTAIMKALWQIILGLRERVRRPRELERGRKGNRRWNNRSVNMVLDCSATVGFLRRRSSVTLGATVRVSSSSSLILCERLWFYLGHVDFMKNVFLQFSRGFLACLRYLYNNTVWIQ